MTSTTKRDEVARQQLEPTLTTKEYPFEEIAEGHAELNDGAEDVRELLEER